MWESFHSTTDIRGDLLGVVCMHVHGPATILLKLVLRPVRELKRLRADFRREASSGGLRGGSGCRKRITGHVTDEQMSGSEYSILLL